LKPTGNIIEEITSGKFDNETYHSLFLNQNQGEKKNG